MLKSLILYHIISKIATKSVTYISQNIQNLSINYVTEEQTNKQLKRIQKKTNISLWHAFQRSSPNIQLTLFVMLLDNGRPQLSKRDNN